MTASIVGVIRCTLNWENEGKVKKKNPFYTTIE